MKKIFFSIFILLGAMHLSNAQGNTDAIRTTEIFTIPLKEKINLPLRKLPVELIRAYCEGNIKAYYPLDTTKECSYHEFVAHFHAGACQPEGKAGGEEFGNTPCPESFCSSSDESTLENFLLRIELVQTKRFDKNKSMEIYDVKYVKLKYIYYKHDLEIAVEGPVFKYADIAKLAAEFPDRYKVPNFKNTAENFSIKKILESRMFNGEVVKPAHHPKVYPENKNNNKEHDRHHH